MPQWVGAGSTVYSDYQLAVFGAPYPPNLLPGDLVFLFYIGRAGTPLVQFMPGWKPMPLVGGSMTWGMAWKSYAAGDAQPTVRASSTHMTWAMTFAYRGAGFDVQTGLPYEGLAMDNPDQNLLVPASMLFPALTPQGNGRLIVKTAIAWVHDHTTDPTAQLNIHDAMTARGPLAQQRSVALGGDHLLRFTDIMDMPGSWGVTASGNSIDTTHGDIAARIATLCFALLPA